jgi:hypothetical protein
MYKQNYTHTHINKSHTRVGIGGFVMMWAPIYPHIRTMPQEQGLSYDYTQASQRKCVFIAIYVYIYIVYNNIAFVRRKNEITVLREETPGSLSTPLLHHT